MGHKKLVNQNPAENYPEYLKKVASSSEVNANAEEPLVFSLIDEKGRIKFKDFVSKVRPVSVIDNYAEQYAELLLSKNAHLYQANYEVQIASIKKLLKEHYASKKEWELGKWVYFPWSGELTHVLSQDDFEDLRTIRNRDLISVEEQNKLFNFSSVCFGMSVGSASAIALALSGISRKIKLVDGAVISGSNLNRIMTGVTSVGKSKALVVGQAIYEMNPYSNITYFNKADSENIKTIFDANWPAKLAIDEIDDIKMKIQIRIEARKRRIPVLMATELSDTVMLDVERFDLEPDRPLFHDLLPGVEETLNRNLKNQREWMKSAVKIIDPKNMPLKMQESLLKIGSTIVTHPQLGSTVMITGGVVAFAAKKIALGERLNSGRYIISLEKTMLPEHNTRKFKRHHKKHTQIILRAINSM